MYFVSETAQVELRNGRVYKTFARTGKFIEHDGENIADGEANAKDLVRNLHMNVCVLLPIDLFRISAIQ